MSKLGLARRKAHASLLVSVLLLSGLLVFPASAASSWSKPRPSSYTPYYETIGNSKSDSIASIGMGVQIWDYVERPEGYLDVLTLRISASVNTREGIQYTWGSLSFNWYTVSNPTGITGDDAGVWLSLPFPVLYYGVEYTKVWVCSNGFLSFDWPSTSPTPQTIPNENKPNSTVAPFWRDLNPAAGGSITYGYVGLSRYGPLFVISWNGVRNKNNGVEQTFQVVIRSPVSGGYGYYHNWIIFQYQSITKDYQTTVGIEDQVGDKGKSYDYNQLSNRTALVLAYTDAAGYDTVGYRLEQLKIRITKSDGYARLDFQETSIGGYNVLLKSTDDGQRDFYTSAIEYAGGLLVAALIEGPVAGIIYGGLLVLGHGAAASLSAGLSEPQFQVDDATEYENEANVTAPAKTEQYYLTGPNPFDSTLTAIVEWLFLDPNNMGHDLTITAEASYKDLSYGYYYTISTSTTLNMYISSGDGGGGGCPYVFTWDGSKYLLDNNVLPASESSDGTDVTDFYMLQQMLAQRVDGTYSILLSEFENEHDFFDHIQLLAVDYPSNVNVAVSPYGEILTYTNPSPPVSVIDDNNRNVKSLLNSIDGNYYEGPNGSYITLNFGDLDVSQGAKLIVRSDQYEEKSPVCVQTMNRAGEWQTIATIHTRTYWSTDIIDMSKHLPDARGNLKVRLYFVSNDKIDFVGLDTSPQATIHIQEGQLVSAIHSTEGDVTTKLLYSDQTHAQLVPGQEIKPTFTLPSQTMEARNYIIKVEGHYYTITT